MMSYWQGVRYLIWTNIRHSRWTSNFLYLFFIVYATIFTYTDLTAIVSGSNHSYSRFLVDYTVILFFSVAGLCPSQAYGLDFTKDYLGERLHYWRTLPIRIDQMIWSRLIGTMISGLVAIVAYYVILFVMMTINGHSLELIPYLLHGLSVYAITSLLSLVYLCFEMAKHYKHYLIFSFIAPFALLIMIAILNFVWKFSVLEELYAVIQRAPIVTAIASLTFIAVSFGLTFRILNRLIRSRPEL